MRMIGTHKLIHPIVLETRDASGEVKEEELKPAGFCVTLRRPKAKDLRVLDEFADRPVAGSLALLTRVSNLDDIEVENIDGEDMEALGNVLDKAPRSGPKTGETA